MHHDYYHLATLRLELVMMKGAKLVTVTSVLHCFKLCINTNGTVYTAVNKEKDR